MNALRRSLALALVALAALLGAACSSESSESGPAAGAPAAGPRRGADAEPDRDRPFVYNIGAEPRSLDPGKATEINASVVLKNVFEGLTRPLPSGKVDPAAAERWDVSEDGRTYTFHLRENGRWSNGDPVTAHDFAESWFRVLDPGFIAEYAYAMYLIEGAREYKETTAEGADRPGRDTVGIRALDDRTLEVRLVAPTPYLVNFLDHSTFMPVHASARGADDAWANDPATFISNGPYIIEAILPKEAIRLARNPHHRDRARIGLRNITFRMIENANTALTEFETGRLHGIHSDLDPADLPRLRATNKLRTMPELSVYFVCFNTSRPPFDNKNLRKAFALALNRAQLCVVMDTGDRPSTAFLPGGLAMPDGRDFREVHGTVWEDNQPDAARAALKEAGYDDPKAVPPITYLYNTTNRHKLVAEYLQHAWSKELGVDVRTQNQEFKVLIENRTKGEYTVCRHGWVGDYPDPMTFLDMFLSTSGNNDAKWKNPQYDELIYAAQREIDATRRLELLAQAERILLEDYVIAPLFHYVSNYTLTDDVEGIERDIMQTVRFDRARWVR